MREQDEARRISGLIAGALLLLLGAAFLLQNAGLLRAGTIGDYWPLLLVWMGLSRLLGPRRERRFVWGITLLAMGVFFQLERLDLLDWRARDFWPVLLLIIGFGLIADAIGSRRRTIPPGSGDAGGSEVRA